MMRRVLEVLVLLLASISAACISGCSAAVSSQVAASSGQGVAVGPMREPAYDNPWVLSELVPPQSLPRVDEEIWVIQKSAAPAAQAAHVQQIGLMAKRSGNGGTDAMPLLHTDVNASIRAFIATVRVSQQFQNPYAAPIEAVYTFPLPQDAAVDDFVMTIGQRRIRGIVRERADARRIYQRARGLGYVVSLLEQTRPNVFSQAIAHLEPHQPIDVTIEYFHTVRFADGAFEFTFPAIGGSPAIAVQIEAGSEIGQVTSPTRPIQLERPASGRATVTATQADADSSRPFVLRYATSGERTRASAVAGRDAEGTYLAVMLTPPAMSNSKQNLDRQRVRIVFAMDVSSRLRGRPLEQSREIIRAALARLRSDDTFQIIRYSDAAQQFAAAPVAATPSNIQNALRWLRSTSTGGASLPEALRAALVAPADEGRLPMVWFCTDGRVGNETAALKVLHDNIGDSRVCCFAVGAAPNSFLLESAARMGRGAVAYIENNDDAGSVGTKCFETMSQPILRDVSVNWGGAEVEMAGENIPDLLPGRPLFLVGRCRAIVPQTISLRGRANGEMREITVPVGTVGADRAMPAVWARRKIADLAERAGYEPDPKFAEQVRDLSLQYGLLSAYTDFVTVDALSRPQSSAGKTE